jgi:hypothetical protein
MGTSQKSVEMPSRGNCTTTRMPPSWNATGRCKYSVQKKCTKNVLMSLLSCFCLCISSAGWKDNLLVHIAQILTSLVPAPWICLAKVVLDNQNVSELCAS